MTEQRIETERLVLRAWRPDDANELFRWARDPGVGPAAGWAPNESVKQSREIIATVLGAPENYALCERGTDAPIGAAGLKIGRASSDELALGTDAAELGYWLARPFWGRGYMSEAVRALIRHGFVNLGLTDVWGLHYTGNDRSRHVMERCGLTYVRTTESRPHPVSGEPVREDVRRVSRAMWESSHTR
jgi:RimJ/RimL family protein N-acetyltransferase